MCRQGEGSHGGGLFVYKAATRASLMSESFRKLRLRWMASIAQSGRRVLQPVSIQCPVDKSRAARNRSETWFAHYCHHALLHERTGPFLRRSRHRLGTHPPHLAVMLFGDRSMRKVRTIANQGFDCCSDYQVFR
jgi:hypothetical protein